jgi:hypothetical protein
LQPGHSRQAFEKFLAARGLRVPGLSVPDGIDAMFAFYRGVRADGCDLAGDGGDMLLYQWGMYDWGQGNHFELDITRQLILADREDEEIWQLSLTFLFAPSPALHALHAGSRWCHSVEECDELRTFILSTSAYTTSAATSIWRVDLDYDLV